MADQVVPKRRVRTLTEACDLVAAWRASGQNKEAWCRSQGVLRSALMSCLYRVDNMHAGAIASPGFIEIRPPTSTPSPSADSPPIPPIVLDLGHGMRVLGMDVAQVVDLVRVLRQERA